jgi:hypothetical protein
MAQSFPWFAAVAMRLAAAFVVLASILCSAPLHAQELEPRAYSPAPEGVNFAIAGYSRSTGSVLFDPSLPVTDTEATINSFAAGYLRTFGLAGRSASLGVVIPYANADLTGNVSGTPSQAHRSGMGDVRLRGAVNLIGGPALSPQEFAARPASTTLGASLSVVAPTGQYEPSRLINIGSNRWAFKPELGLSLPAGNWFFEATAGVWLFTDNAEFNGDSRRSQEPLRTYQAHAGYTFRPGLWLAVDATYYTGGQTSINGADKADIQENSRYGATLSIPLGREWSAKLAWTTGFSTRVGNDFRTSSLLLQYRWFDR